MCYGLSVYFIRLTSPHSAFDLLCSPSRNLDSLITAIPSLSEVDSDIRERVQIEGSYHGHMDRQEADVEAFLKYENFVLSPDIDYSAIVGLSSEVKERLAKVRPVSIVSTSCRPIEARHMLTRSVGCGTEDGGCDTCGDTLFSQICEAGWASCRVEKRGCLDCLTRYMYRMSIYITILQPMIH